MKKYLPKRKIKKRANHVLSRRNPKKARRFRIEANACELRKSRYKREGVSSSLEQLEEEGEDENGS